MARACTLILAAAVMGSTHAEIFKWEEFSKRTEQAGTVAALEEGVFGEQVNLANGGTSFSVTDVSLPGNSALPVAFGRTFTVSNRKDYPTNEGALADWELDVPRISGVFAQDWTGSYPGNPGKRCSVTSVNHARPPAPGFDLNVEDVWQGNVLSIPGVGGGELLVSTATTRPTDGPAYHWYVDGQIHVACLANASDGAGKEGFLAITPDGTRYWFDTMAQYFEPSLAAYGHPHAVPRRRNVLYASRVEDRHGHWVTYSYSHAWNAPARLDSIQSSDGRTITIAYANGRVSAVTAGSRSWTYHYGSTPDGQPTLQHVDLPDHSASAPSRWSYALGALSRAAIRYPVGHRLEPVRDCIVNASPLPPTRFTGAITHPAGATAEFTFDVLEHGRSSVPVSCSHFTTGPDGNDLNDDVNHSVISAHSLTLTKKRVSGPAVAAMEWTYAYVPNIGVHYYPGTTPSNPVCMIGDCTPPPCTNDSCAQSSVTTVAAPNGDWTRYSHGNTYRYNEGKLLKVEVGAGGTALRGTEHTYDLGGVFTSYPQSYGSSARESGDGFTSERHRPRYRTAISQQQKQFVWQATDFSWYAHPLAVTQSNTLAGTSPRTETFTYEYNPAKWVVGPLKQHVLGGVEVARTHYDGNSMPVQYDRYSQKVQTVGYHAAPAQQKGAVATVSDGRDAANFDTTVRYDHWFRGIPTQVTQPATATQPSHVQDASVTADGWIDGMTDQLGYSTCFEHDAMGRLTKTTYPSDTGACSATTWNPIQRALTRATAAAYGLPAGHWQHRVETGQGVRIVHLDALLRPVVEETYDAGNAAATRSLVVRRYDAKGRLDFQSYPVPSLGTYTATLAGTWFGYDALDRPTSTVQDSELGPLTTGIAYPDGNLQRRTVNPRGQVTLESFLAWDAPGYELPVRIDQPEGVATEIVRNVFGHPVEIRRTGPDLAPAGSPLHGPQMAPAAPPHVSMGVPSGQQTAPATFQVNASAASVVDGRWITSIEIHHNGAVIASSATDFVAATVSNLPAGQHQFYAAATDNFGEVGASTTRTVTVVAPGSNAPTVALAPPTGSPFIAPATIGLSATASDSDGQVTKVEFFANGALLGTRTAPPYTLTWSNVGEGTHALTARATDNSGNTTTSATQTVTVTRSQITGYIDGVVLSGGQYHVRGWACSTGRNDSVQVHLYAGGPAGGGGVGAGAYTANLASEPGIATACHAQGTHYRFLIPLSEATRHAHANKTIHVHGISPVGAPNLAISRSGMFTIPPLLSGARLYYYDTQQRLCRSVEPETGSTVHAYDAAGNVVWTASGLNLSGTGCQREQVPTGERVLRAWDTRGRLTDLQFPGGNGSQAWTYTPDGLPASVLTWNDGGNNWVTNSYSYNSRRLLAGESQAVSDGWTTWSFGYGYNQNGHLASLAYPGAFTIDYAPNALGQPTRAGTFATGVSYHPSGAIKQFTYGNGLVFTMAENARGMPDRMRSAQGSLVVHDEAMDYDQNGNVAAISDALPGHRGDRTMAYDGLDRLTGVTSPMFPGGVVYAYDALDNLRRVKAPGRDHTYHYDGSNRLHNVTNTVGGGAVIGLGYDVRGNLANRNGQTYQFDHGNRLRVATGLERYDYDAEGRRVRARSAGNVPIYSVYGKSGQLLFQRDERVARRFEYVYLGDRLIATRRRPIGDTSETLMYYHTDLLGSNVAITGQTQQVLQRSEYEPYGQVINRPTNNRIGFTGHVEDAATGLVYMQQRYYDPEIGRTLSVDPVTAYGSGDMRHFNVYAYAYNNPYKFVDPDGRSGVAFLGGLITESWNALNGRGFDGAMVMGALKDGYNGEGGGVAGAVIEDASAVATVVGGIGALRSAGTLAAKGGKEIASRLTKGAVKDDVKGGVRQVVKTGGEKQMGRDMAQASRGAQSTKTVETQKGVVRTAEHSDGTTVSARSFSSDGRPTVQVNSSKVDEVIKVRYDP